MELLPIKMYYIHILSQIHNSPGLQAKSPYLNLYLQTFYQLEFMAPLVSK